MGEVKLEGFVRSSRQFAIAMIAVAAFSATSTCKSEEAERRDNSNHQTGVLTLVNDNFVNGQLGASPTSNSITWQATDFVEPFDFRLAAIESIRFPVQRVDEPVRGEFAFEFINGDVVTGSLTGWTRDAIEIRSDHFGDLVVRTNSIRRLHRIEENATVVFASLAGLQDWATTSWDTSGWNEDGDHLWTSSLGAALNGDLDVPSRAVLEFEISWSDRPDFVFAIGVDPENESDQPTDGWRFETVGDSLAILREDEASADVRIVTDLTHVQRVRLTAYVDQARGEMNVLIPDGSSLATIGPRADDRRDPAETAGRGVRLINRGKQLRLERLRIAKWLGGLPKPTTSGQASIALDDGSFISGAIERFDTDEKSLIVGENEQEMRVELDRVIAVKFTYPKTDAPEARCAVFTHGGMRLSGDLIAIEEKDWIISGDNFDQHVRVPRQRVRTLVVFENDKAELTRDVPPGRVGRLETDVHTISGRLIPESESDDAACLRWHPGGSNRSGRLRTTAPGRIVYRDPPKPANTAAARALAMQRLRLQQQKRGLNFGELFLRRTDNAKSKTNQRDTHVVHIRSGDVIACHVDSIDQEGVHLSTRDVDHGFVTHENVKAIELVSNSAPPDLKEAKRNRLMTIPRLQKSYPPSHLICSRNGDFLRCRLVGMDEETVRIEVQLEELEIPRVRVAQIIWFHPDETESSPSPSTDSNPDPSGDAPTESKPTISFADMAQVVDSDGKRLTFNPSRVTEESIIGVSDVLGEFSFDIAKMDQLIFGDRIGSEVSDLAYNRWKLQAALEPLAVQASADSPAMGHESALVGQEAPEIRLEMLDGGEFRLSDCQGTIVVLDFWASWCAPCMLTMPLVEEVVNEFDPNRVQLVSINLEETAQQIRDTLDRHEMNVSVALDIDGVAAQHYQARAIPQLVIVDGDGKIARLYVGGGAEVVEQMRSAISEMLGEDK